MDSDLAEANRHVNAQHGLNLVQYYKMASGKGSKGNMKMLTTVIIEKCGTLLDVTIASQLYHGTEVVKLTDIYCIYRGLVRSLSLQVSHLLELHHDVTRALLRAFE